VSWEFGGRAKSRWRTSNPVASEAFSNFSGYVLAGGASSRFGRDKALSEAGGVVMLERMLRLVRGSGIEEVRVVGAAQKYSGFGAMCIEDKWPGEGPLGGIVTALENARKDLKASDWSLIVSCDMPFLTREWLAFLCRRAAGSDAQVVVARSEHGMEPLCACWQTDAAPVLRGGFEHGVRKVTGGIEVLRAEVLDEGEWKRFDSAGRLFWNMNTPADYEEARRILEAEST
jgi:molybdopterin-guanine dinucleotide biosynthesis protein A